MPATCVIGLQWGDEAKGKLVDILTPRFEIVVRYQGGANAGHTVVVGDKTYKVHQIPSGVLSPGAMNVVTPGVVLHPGTLIKEIDTLKEQGVEITPQNFMLSDRMHVVFPWHILEDRLLNSSTTDGEDIGTTLRGIGPCYRDKVGRAFAIRLGDMIRPDLKEKIASTVTAKTSILASLNGHLEANPLDADAIYEEYHGYAERLREYIADTTAFLLDSVEADRRLLFEGAQGSLLDVDHGTYPFVTSSNSSALGVSSGSGIPGRWIGQVIGVVKAYATRVGGGPFPTELHDVIGQHIRDEGNEYGTTTGRPRRCGWFDAVAARYTARLCGVDGLSLMMLDVLSKLPEIQICTAYKIDGEITTTFPSHVDDLRKVQPVYETIAGWEQDVTGARQLSDLPAGARRYVDRISEVVGRPVDVISVGPDRAQTIFLKEDLQQVAAEV